MNSHRCAVRLLAVAVGAQLVLGAGCANIFVAKHKVLVDAISLPDAPKPSGQSYRLLAKASVVNQTPVQIPVVKACVDAALSGQGMFEAPPNAPPDVFIEVGFGRDTSPRIDPAARETFLQLSARTNPDRSMDKPTGPEIWDVRVAVLGIAGRVETALPLLASVAAGYIATNTGMELKVQVPQNSPSITAVRETALKALEGRPPPPSAPVTAKQAGGAAAPTPSK